MTTDNPCPMTDAAADARTLRVDVCPCCGSSKRDTRGVMGKKGEGSTHYHCVDKWHDQPAPSQPKSLLREPSKPPGKTGVEFVDSLADQWGARQSAALRGDMTGIKNADMWLGIIAKEYWGEIIESLRKTHAPPPAEPVSATPSDDEHSTAIDIDNLYSEALDASCTCGIDENSCAHCGRWNKAYSALLQLERELAEAKRELERERIRLAACGVVAMSDTPESAKTNREMREDYRSASCDDVARRVDECIELRSKLAKAEARAAELQTNNENLITQIQGLVASVDHERAIVDRIWDLFGRPSYEELKGRSIYELITELQAKLDAETARADQAHNAGFAEAVKALAIKVLQ